MHYGNDAYDVEMIFKCMTFLYRYIRWDGSTEKFSIHKHTHTRTHTHTECSSTSSIMTGFIERNFLYKESF